MTSCATAHLSRAASGQQVPGAHLYRQSNLRSSAADEEHPYDGSAPPGHEDDRHFEKTWLRNKLHPLTGEPLRILKPALPPGSMCVCLCHMPHGVEPRPEGTGTRHCTLFSYREPDPEGLLPVSTNAGLQPWELERDAAAGKIAGVAGGPVNLFSLY